MRSRVSFWAMHDLTYEQQTRHELTIFLSRNQGIGVRLGHREVPKHTTEFLPLCLLQVFHHRIGGSAIRVQSAQGVVQTLKGPASLESNPSPPQVCARCPHLHHRHQQSRLLGVLPTPCHCSYFWQKWCHTHDMSRFPIQWSS